MKEQATAKLKHLRMSPRKVRLLVDLIRGLKVENAIIQLEHNVKHAARPILKLLQSAVANAKQNHSLIEDTLVIKVAFVDEASTLHRWMPRAMGRATPLRKRGSHVTIVLEGDVKEEKKAVKAKKTEKKIVEEETISKEIKKETVKKVENKEESKKAVKK